MREARHNAGMERYRPPVRLGTLNLARIIRDGRELAGLSQAHLARRAGIGRDAIARLEGGHGGMALRDVERVLAALDAAGIVLRSDGRPDLGDAPLWAMHAR